MNPFQQLLNAAGRTYRAADKRLGGWLPGGGVPSPVNNTARTINARLNQAYGQLDKNVFRGTLPGGASISSTIARDIRNISQSPIYRTVRDEVAIPLLDRGMEAGVIPAKEGMFARFLSGTSQPLTRIPADTQMAESMINTRLTNPTEMDKKLYTLQDATNAWLNKSRPLSAQAEMYSMHGIGSPVTKQQWEEVNQLEQRANDIAKKLGMQEINDFYTRSDYLVPKRQIGYDPMNYVMDDYSTLGSAGLGFSDEQTNLINKGLVNTLGRYQVQRGQTVNERYDFNSYNVSKPLFAPRSMVGGVIGETEDIRKLADKALSLADKFGFIEPGAGYPVQFKFR